MKQMESNAGFLLIKAIEDKVKLYSTEMVLLEMQRITSEKLGFTEKEIDEILSSLPIEWIEEYIFAEGLKEAMEAINDEGDASLLACAQFTGMEIITGDKELLEIEYENVITRSLRSPIEEK